MITLALCFLLAISNYFICGCMMNSSSLALFITGSFTYMASSNLLFSSKSFLIGKVHCLILICKSFFSVFLCILSAAFLFTLQPRWMLQCYVAMDAMDVNIAVLCYAPSFQAVFSNLSSPKRTSRPCWQYIVAGFMWLSCDRSGHVM